MPGYGRSGFPKHATGDGQHMDTRQFDVPGRTGGDGELAG